MASVATQWWRGGKSATAGRIFTSVKRSAACLTHPRRREGPPAREPGRLPVHRLKASAAPPTAPLPKLRQSAGAQQTARRLRPALAPRQSAHRHRPSRTGLFVTEVLAPAQEGLAPGQPARLSGSFPAPALSPTTRERRARLTAKTRRASAVHNSPSSSQIRRSAGWLGGSGTAVRALVPWIKVNNTEVSLLLLLKIKRAVI